MSEDRWTLQEFADKAAWEGGFDGAFGYFGEEIGEYVTDPELLRLYAVAWRAVTELLAYLPEAEV